jgi:hypothetical protein
VRYLRFKADESSQTITGPYRQLHPEDNNERQAIHEHVSVPLAALNQTAETGHAVTAALGRRLERSSTYARVSTSGGSK